MSMSSIIVAQANNRVIGSKNDLPWYLPADLKHFKDLTTGKTVVMGGLTFESIKTRLNGPLPNRRNIIVSHILKPNSEDGFEICNSIDGLKKLVDIDSEDVFIIGGGQLYRSSLEEGIVSKIFLTQIYKTIQGDTYFPELSPEEWREVDREKHIKDEKNKYDYDFIELVKIV